MAIMMSDEELLAGIREMADKGVLVTTGWSGFRAIVEGSPPEFMRGGMTDEQEYALRLAFWAGARCVFDVLHRLEYFCTPNDEWHRLEKLKAELGDDPFCRPPAKRETH